MRSPILSGEVAGQECRHADREIAGELVEADRQAARFRSDEINLHDHRHRPGEPLIDAEQGVGGDHPFPAWRPHEHERDGQTEQPTEHQHALPPPHIGKLPLDIGVARPSAQGQAMIRTLTAATKP